jgi:hypothetical protein
VTGSGFQTVLTGAGISIAHPSNMPNGDGLAIIAWGLLVDSLAAERGGHRVPRVAGDAEGRIRGSKIENHEHEGLRLEQLLQILEPWYPRPAVLEASGQEINSPLLAVYETVSDNAWNFNHLALTRLGVKNFTVNMDTLIDTLSATEVVHLHGKWSEPESIVSTVTRSLGGLSPRNRAEFSDGLAGKSVLVMGYSGRDQDVLPMFREFPPSRLTWVQYPGDPLEPEVVRIHEALRLHGVDVEVVSKTAEDFLAEKLQPMTADLIAQRSLARIPNAQKRAATAHARALVDSIDVRLRWLAFANVLYDLGLNLNVSRVLAPQHWRGRLDVARRKMLARAMIRLGHPSYGLALLLPPRVPSRDQFGPYLRNANEVANILPTVGHPRLAETIDFVLSHSNDVAPSAERAGPALQSRVRRGKHANVRGNIFRALHHFEIVARNATAWQQIGVGAEVDARTWHADALKLRGEVLEAAAWADRAREHIDYANYSQRAWATWKVAELKLVSSGPSTDVENLLEESLSLANLAGDAEATFWIHCTTAGAIGRDRPSEAFALLDTAQKMVRHGHGEGILFLLIQRAELQRFHGNHAAAILTLHDMKAREANRHALPFGCAPALLSGSLVLADTRRVSGETGPETSSTIRTLERIRAAALRRGFDLHAAHASTSLAIASGTTGSPDTVRDYRERGWILEAERLENPTKKANDLWQVVM